MWSRAVTVASLACLNICWGLVASIQAPFFPHEAVAKGATASQFGGVLGVVHLGILLSAPAAGLVTARLGLWRLYTAGLVVSAISALTFSLLTWLPGPTAFLAAAYTLRLLEGLGGAALWTSMLALLLSSFPGRSGLVYSLVDSTFGVGYSLGPVLGSALHSLAGFPAPFLVCGAGLLVTGLTSLPLVRPLTLLDPAPAPAPSPGTAQLLPRLLTQPRLVLALLSATITALAIGYIESLLSLHLASLGLGLSATSLSFLAMSAAYTVASLTAGWLGDTKHVNPWTLNTAGLLCCLGGFVLLGPGLPACLATALAGLLLQGAGAGAALVASYTCALQVALATDGFGETPSTLALVSGLWTAAFALGNLVGPFLAGVLYDSVGFQWGGVGVQAVLAIIAAAAMLVSCRDARHRLIGNKLYQQLTAEEEIL